MGPVAMQVHLMEKDVFTVLSPIKSGKCSSISALFLLESKGATKNLTYVFLGSGIAHLALLLAFYSEKSGFGLCVFSQIFIF